MSRKYFGTDGIRGKVGEYPITAEFVLKLGWAAGKVFAGQGKRHILIGKDTRISGYMFESALEAGLSAAGVDVGLLGPMPTPGIAYLTRTFHADAGIVISASHNPHFDNGIKFFSAHGTKLDDEIEADGNSDLLICKKCGAEFNVGTKGASKLKELCSRCHSSAISMLLDDASQSVTSDHVAGIGEDGEHTNVLTPQVFTNSSIFTKLVLTPIEG